MTAHGTAETLRRKDYAPMANHSRPRGISEQVSLSEPRQSFISRTVSSGRMRSDRSDWTARLLATRRKIPRVTRAALKSVVTAYLHGPEVPKVQRK